MKKKFLPISDFAQSGLNSDLIAWDLPPNFLTDIRNTRIIGRKLKPFIGGQVWHILPTSLEPGFIMFSGTQNSRIWIIAGSGGVYLYDGGSTDIDKTPTSLAGITVENKGDWVGCMLSAIPIINHPVITPWYLPEISMSADFVELPFTQSTTWSEEGQSCKIVRAHKQFLFALDLDTPNGPIPDGVRWSAPADIGSVPETWDELDQTNVAGLTQLGGDGGDIIDGLSMRDAFVVYRQRSISVFDFTGGQYVWQIRHLSTTTGLISSDAIVEVNGRHYFIGDGDIYVNDGNSITSLIHNRIRDRFNAELNKEYYYNCYAIKNTITSEIWFCIPTKSNTYPDTAYVYNWRDDTWTILDICSTEQVPSMSYGSEEVTGDTWNIVQGDWDQANYPWNSGSSSPFDNNLIGVQGYTDREPFGYGLASRIVKLDVKANPGILTTNCRFERLGFAIEGFPKNNTITRLYPHAEGPGKFNVIVGSMQYPGAPTRWLRHVLFDPLVDRKIDIRTTGELHCFYIYEEDRGTDWSLSGLDIEYVPAGER